MVLRESQGHREAETERKNPSPRDAPLKSTSVHEAGLASICEIPVTL